MSFQQNYTGNKLERVRLLRRLSTNSEKKLWMFLRRDQLGVHFRRQVPVGNYIVDFAALQCMLVVEVDGSQHKTISGKAYDQHRDEYLMSRGFTVLRFSNGEVIENIDAVLEKIHAYVVNAKRVDPSPSLPYQGREHIPGPTHSLNC